MQLHLDGLKVGANAGVTGAQEYSGFWRIGGDNLGGWPDQPSSSYFNGSIDEVAIYPTALSGAQIRDHYTKSGRTVAIPAAPTDAYGQAVYNDDPALYWRLNEASGSTAVDVDGQPEQRHLQRRGQLSDGEPGVRSAVRGDLQRI